MLKRLTSASWPFLANLQCSDNSYFSIATRHHSCLRCIFAPVLLNSSNSIGIHKGRQIKAICNNNYYNNILSSELHVSLGSLTSEHDDSESQKQLASPSTIFLQDGLNIEELPILVQTATWPEDINGDRSSTSVQKNSSDMRSAKFIINNVEVAAVQDGLKRCNSLSEIFELLEVIPVEEVTPQVATFALHRIATLQAMIGAGLSSVNNMSSILADGSTYNPNNSNGLIIDTFAWRAIVDRLVKTICLSKLASVLLEGLKAIILVRKFAQDASTSTPVDDYIDVAIGRLVRECMAIVAKGKLSVEDTCDLARTLNSIGSTKSRPILKMKASSSASSPPLPLNAGEVDKLWPSFVDKSLAIDESNVSIVFATLPLFSRNPRKVILAMLQKRMHDFWWKLKASDILVILDTLQSIHFVAPSSFLISLTKWFSLSLHTLTESDVSKVVTSLRRLDHFDANIASSLERYVKARSNKLGGNGFEDPELVASISDFCVHFRYSSPVILDGLASWFVSVPHYSLSTEQIFRVARTFGFLNHVPSTIASETHTSGTSSVVVRQFFTALEESIDSRFVMFKPEDLVELLLNCTHIQRYPLNFIRRIVSPFFLDKLNGIQDEAKKSRATLYLRLLDNAMTIEVPNYGGPMLHNDRSARLMQKDGRLARFHYWLDDDFADVLGGRDKFTTMELVQNVALANIYICDFIFNLDESNVPLPFYKTDAGIHKKKAVIVHLPEDYTMYRRCLVGQQAARLRHLKKLGYTVLQFDYHELENLRTQPSSVRVKYLRSKLLF